MTMRRMVAALLLLPGLLAAEKEPAEAPERVVLRTRLGDLALTFYPGVAPRHVAQILALVRLGVYDGVPIFRIHPGFVAQLANAQARPDPLTPAQAAAVHPLPAEFSTLPHCRGVLSMAREDDRPDSAETSFSILLGSAPHLDGKYTVFGRVELGLEVLDALAAVPCDPAFHPLEPLVVDRAEVLNSPGDMAGIRLKPAVRPSAPPAPRIPTAWMAGAAGACALAALLLGGRVPPRVRASLWLLPVLVGFFYAFVVLAPRASDSAWLGLALLAATLGLFRLMGRFERQG